MTEATETQETRDLRAAEWDMLATIAADRPRVGNLRADDNDTVSALMALGLVQVRRYHALPTDAGTLLLREHRLARYLVPRDGAGEPLREADLDGSTHCSIPSDDAPPDEADRLHVMFGGNLDYYLTVGKGRGLRWPLGPAFRACTSGARNPVVTSIVAALFKAIRGERAGAQDCLRNAIRELGR